MGRGSEVLAYKKLRSGIRKFYEKRIKETQYFSWGNVFFQESGEGEGGIHQGTVNLLHPTHPLSHPWGSFRSRDYQR